MKKQHPPVGQGDVVFKQASQREEGALYLRYPKRSRYNNSFSVRESGSGQHQRVWAHSDGIVGSVQCIRRNGMSRLNHRIQQAFQFVVTAQFRFSSRCRFRPA